jgi:hypothetical protein
MSGGEMSLRLARTMTWLALGAGSLLGAARADQWDLGTDADNSSGTDNAPFHGAEQIHDLGALPGALPDEDWYITRPHPFSSYEFVVDGMTGNLDLLTSGVQLVTSTGTALATSTGYGTTLSLSYRRGTTVENSFIRVRGALCGTGCTGTDTYRARFYDTTYTIPRFNNSGTQTTALLIQNNTSRGCEISIFFMDAAGALIVPGGTTGTHLAPYALNVFAPPGVAGQSGSVRIAHECGYGGLSGKAVSVEPSTGFTFDTPMLHRPR